MYIQDYAGSESDTVPNDSPGNVQTVYGRSLRALRQDVGCTPERLVLHAELVSALRTRLARQGKPPSAAECVAELSSVVQTLSNPKHRDALLVALRLDQGHLQPTLTERREDFSRALRQSSIPQLRAQSVDNIRTLERRENEGIEEVARLLAEAQFPEPDAHPTGRPVKNAEEYPPRIVTTATTNFHFFSTSGVLVRNDVLTEKVATGSAPVNKFTTWRRYYGDPRPGVLSITALFGCYVIDTREDATGGITADLGTFRDLDSASGPYLCGFRVSVNSTVRSLPVIQTMQGTDQPRIAHHLIFDAAARPLRAWWYSSDGDVEGRIEPSPEEHRHLELLDQGKYIYKEFDPAQMNLKVHYGIAWIWAE
jgi:hypothetical protein